MTFYSINSTDVSSEYFDNEVLAINLKSGNYFSLRASAFVFWKLLHEGNSIENSIELISNHFDIEKEKAMQIFTDFTNQLIQNELIIKSEESPMIPNNDWLKSIENTFYEPLLECYTDMQDLLLFDPIHDVDTQVGWPKKSEDSSN